MKKLIANYVSDLTEQLRTIDSQEFAILADALLDAVKSNKQVFLCGNGGSAGNAVHLANDFLYGIAPNGNAMRVEALSANQAVLTCLGNDIGYDKIYSHQLKVKADAGDLLIVLSGSGNSANIIAALETANSLEMKTFAILGYSGGAAKSLAHTSLHFAIADMQISEDMQVVVGHLLMRYLNQELAK